MFRIWKYPIEIDDIQSFNMPKDAKILCVKMQMGEPCIWVLVDEKSSPENRTFRLAGTGHPVKKVDNLHYIGTFLIGDGMLVFHLFEKKEKI